MVSNAVQYGGTWDSGQPAIASLLKIDGVVNTDGCGVVNTAGSGVVNTAGSGVVNTDGSGVANTDGSGVVNTDGSGVANTDGSGVVNTDGSGVVNTDGSGVVNTDGSGVANTDGSGVVNTDESGVVNTDGSGVVNTDESGVVNTDGSGVVNTDGSGVVNTDGSGLVNTDGSGVVNTDGSGVVNTDGSGVVNTDGSGVVNTDGSGLVNTDGSGVVNTDLVKREERSFDNPFLNISACKLRVESAPSQKAEVPSELKAKLLDSLERNLELIDDAYKCPERDTSVYTGSAGAAYLHLHMATTLHADSPEQRSHHLTKALDLLRPSLEHLHGDKTVTFLCGSSGPLALGTIVCDLLGRREDADRCVGRLRSLYLEHKKSFTSMPSELLFGHVGYLYSLLYVNSYLPRTIEESLIAEVANFVLDVGEAGKEPDIPSPLMYTWHGKHYLGAAHGLAGIMTVLLQVYGLVPSLQPRISALVKPCVDYLLSLKMPSGNFPSSLESAGTDKLVHWCHGAAGVVHMFAHAYRVFGDRKYLDAAVDCGEVVWDRGLLRKGYGLCHGVAGNAHTFLQLFRLTTRPEYLNRTVKVCKCVWQMCEGVEIGGMQQQELSCSTQFAEWCLSSSERKCRIPDHPYSLFEGLAGTTLFYIDMVHHPSNTFYPAFELPPVTS
eukprot:Em0015g388a